MQVLIQVMARFGLVYIFHQTFSDDSRAGPVVWFIVSYIGTCIPVPSFILVVKSFVWKDKQSVHELKLVWKYKYWLCLRITFQYNILAMRFADLVRKSVPKLAPCNALQDDVTCSATTSKYLATILNQSVQVHVSIAFLSRFMSICSSCPGSCKYPLDVLKQ